MRDYYDHTDYTKLQNVVCTVCGRMTYTYKKISYPIDYLKQQNEILNVKNLYNNIPVSRTLYSGNFETLNQMIIETKGFNSNDTVR